MSCIANTNDPWRIGRRTDGSLAGAIITGGCRDKNPCCARIQVRPGNALLPGIHIEAANTNRIIDHINAVLDGLINGRQNGRTAAGTLETDTVSNNVRSRRHSGYSDISLDIQGGFDRVAGCDRSGMAAMTIHVPAICIFFDYVLGKGVIFDKIPHPDQLFVAFRPGFRNVAKTHGFTKWIALDVAVR